MYKPLFFTALMTICCLACSKNDQVEGSVKDPIISDIENIASEDIKLLVSKTQSSDSTGQAYPVSLKIGEKEIDLTTITAYRQLESSEYEQYQIPEQASDAIIETSADFNKVIYAYKQLEDRVIVREGIHKTGQDSISYKAIASINSFDISPDPEIDYVDIIGTYGYTDEGKTQILILNFNQRKMLSAMLYTSDEAVIPNGENLALILSKAKPNPLKNFFINEMQRSFNSNSFQGRYRKDKDQIIFIFDNMLNKDGQPAEFKKIAL